MKGRRHNQDQARIKEAEKLLIYLIKAVAAYMNENPTQAPEIYRIINNSFEYDMETMKAINSDFEKEVLTTVIQQQQIIFIKDNKQIKFNLN